jgi:hypothetical protein
MAGPEEAGLSGGRKSRHSRAFKPNVSNALENQAGGSGSGHQQKRRKPVSVHYPDWYYEDRNALICLFPC